MVLPVQGSGYSKCEKVHAGVQQPFDSNHCSLELGAQSFSKKLAASGVHSMQWSEGSLRIPPLIGKVSKLFDLSCVGGLRCRLRPADGCPSKAPPLTASITDHALPIRSYR